MPLIEGRRQSAGRRQIMAAIREMNDHFDPQALYNVLKAKGARVSRASVYRAIPLLLERGVIAQVEKTEKHAHYEKIIGKRHHDHLICLSCGNTIEFYSPTLEMLQSEICQREGFQTVRHSLEIMGYCRQCASQGAREASPEDARGIEPGGGAR